MLSVAIKSGKSVKKVSGVCSAFFTMAISSVVMDEVSFSGDKDLDVVGDKVTELVEGNERGLNVVG